MRFKLVDDGQSRHIFLRDTPDTAAILIGADAIFNLVSQYNLRVLLYSVGGSARIVSNLAELVRDYLAPSQDGPLGGILVADPRTAHFYRLVPILE